MDLNLDEKEKEDILEVIENNKPLNSDDLGEHDHFLIIFWFVLWQFEDLYILRVSLCTFLVVAWLINDYWYKDKLLISKFQDL
jgi:hypothetical protein